MSTFFAKKCTWLIMPHELWESIAESTLDADVDFCRFEQFLRLNVDKLR